LKDGRNRVLIGIGSNINPEENIQKALNKISNLLDITAISAFYWSKPSYMADQEDFLNGCILILTELSPRSLKFDILRPLEDQLGRVRTEDRNSSRTIDLDILLYGKKIIQDKGITIPDPDLFTRNYLLIPTQEIAGEMFNPLTGKKIKEIQRKRTNLQPLSSFPDLRKIRLAK